MRKFIFIISFIVVTIFQSTLLSQVTFTSVASGDWNNPVTWDQNAVPTNVDNVIIDVATTINIDAAAECNNITFNNSTTSKISFNTTGITLSIYGNMIGLNAGDDYTSGISASGTKILFTGSAVQTITLIGGSCNWPDFEVNKAGGSLTTSSNTRIDGNLTVTAGTFDINANAVSMASTSNITVAASGFLINVGRVAQTTGGTAKNNSITIDGTFSSSTGSASINTTTLTVNNGGILDMKGTATGFSNTSGSENPTAMTCNSGSTVRYSGTAATGRFVNYHHLILSGGVSAGSAIKTISAVGTITIGGDLTISNGARLSSGGSFVVTGTTNINDNGEIQWNGGNTSTFIFNGTVNINGNSGNGVIRFGSASTSTPTYTFNGDVIISSTTTVSAFNLNSGTAGAGNRTFEGVINFNGNVTLASTSSTFTSTTTADPASTNINFGGTDKTLSVLAGASFINLRGDYTFKTNRTITSTSTTYFTFTSRPSSVTPEWTVKIDDGVTVTISEGSSVSLPNRAFADGTGAGNLQINGDLRIGLAGGWNAAVTNTGTTNLGAASKITFNGAVGQVTGLGLPASLVNLTVSNSTGVTLSAPTGVTGTLTLSSGNLVNTTNQITMENASTISRATGTFSTAPLFGGVVNLIYTGNVTTGPELPTAENVLDDLTINNATGVTLGSAAVVNGTLTMTTGNLDLGSNNLTIMNLSITSPSAAKMIIADDGELRKFYSGNGAFTFPIGDNTTGNDYSPVTINLIADSYSSAYVSAKVTDAKHPNNTSVTNYLTRYWTLNQSGVTNPVYDIDLFYVDADISGTEGDIYGGKRSGSDWYLLNASTPEQNKVSGAMVSGFSDFSGGEQSALPVELTSFTARAVGSVVNINWETATEVDNNGFDVERNSTGTWQKIGFVEGHGTANSPKYYTFTDKSVTGNKIQYRLRQVDNDGSFEFSNIVEVALAPTTFALGQNYPNPFNPSTKVDYQLAENARVTIELYGMTGERIALLLSEEQEAGYYSMMIDAYKHQLASGIYIYRMIATDALGKNFVATKKMSLIK